ncbi:hypothetical protein NDU88_004705 [Pleurodeles waltl]|uniref:Uncharacterized protein n=1 Tax=Pleurodeles waltl TaxID=8319 RepID=A0AAV7UG07_PLEWA|nr:hypothetical protein NDU88_004705 [Pleurodeles waltl]
MSAPQSSATAPPAADQNRVPQFKAKLSKVDLPPPSAPALTKARPGQASPSSVGGTLLLRPDLTSIAFNLAEIRHGQPGPPRGSQSAQARPPHPPFNGGAQMTGTSGEPKMPGTLEGRPGLSGQPTLRMRAGPPDTAPRAPVPKDAIRAAVRPNRRWPQPPGVERAPRRSHPSTVSEAPPGVPNSKARPSTGGARVFIGSTAWPGPSPSGRWNTVTDPLRGPPQESTRRRRSQATPSPTPATLPVQIINQRNSQRPGRASLFDGHLAGGQVTPPTSLAILLGANAE